MQPPWRLALPMYNVTPALACAWEDLLHAVVDALHRRGWNGAMRVAPVPVMEDLMAFWRSPDLLLSQTCGYPLVTALGEDVRVLAVLAFDLPGCEGICYRSAIVVPNDGAHSLEQLRGSVAAINQAHSHSGMNALRHTLAPLARDGRFLSRIEVSGSHLASLAMVQSGKAQVAAIDCATLGLAMRYAPQLLAGVRTLQYTAGAPGLPLIGSRALSDDQAQVLRDVLLDLPKTARHLLAPLCIRDLRAVTLTDYQPIVEQAQFATDRGYPVLA
ncbi:MAG: PhnD/SsuA/transferrin family substrate-binding protein [Betaproteobacteria bacterium]